MNRILSFLANGTPWAIEASALETIIGIAQRENNLEAVLKERGEPLANTHNIDNRDGVAVIPVTGPLFPRANLFAEISGAYSVEMLALDLARAGDDPDVRGVVLAIDSPGGHITMINEFANQVADFSKPIVAYVIGSAASAAFWIAIAADRVVLDGTAIVGSVGVVAGFESPDKDRIEIVSSNAGDKRPDISTEEGVAVIQALVDDTESVFIDAVMNFRSMDREQITALRGGVVIGAKAVEMGFADEVGSLEGVITSLQQENPMDLENLKADHNSVYQAAFKEGVGSVEPDLFRTEGRKAERERVSAIINHASAEGREAQAKVLALETEMSVEEAVKVLDVSPKAEAKAPAGDQFSEYMERKGNPDVGPDADNDMNDDNLTLLDIAGGKS